MAARRATAAFMALGTLLILSGCGGRVGDMLRGDAGDQATARSEALEQRAAETGTMSSIWDLMANRQDPSTVLSVNRYIWTASLEVLDFLPVETVDPFSGVITTGFGTPPGGGRPYRATIAVTDAALDARSLNVAVMTRNGAASDETVRAVEDAILTRARQIRIRELGL